MPPRRNCQNSKKKSVHREEAEVKFAEVQQEQKRLEEEKPVPSPLDMNIDKLLELPEESEAKTVVTATPPPLKKTTSAASVGAASIDKTDDYFSECE